MNRAEVVKVPPKLILTSLLSGGLTLVLTLIYTTLSIAAIVYRFECDVAADIADDIGGGGGGDDGGDGGEENGGEDEAVNGTAFTNSTITGSGFFMHIIYRVYIQRDDCYGSLSYDGITQADSVFLLVLITLVLTVLCLFAAVALITVVKSKDGSQQYLNIVAYVYIGLYLASLVVDLTVATHFGMDYGYLTEQLDASTVGVANYLLDLLRLGAVLLMTISLKGFVAHTVNIVLMILMVIYLVDYQKQLQRHQHSIHKMGALNAYEQQRRHEDPWQPQNDMFLALPRGPHSNPAYSDDDRTPRSPMREHSLSDRMYDRSESWQPGPTSGARPFSYLEEARRASPARPPPSPATAAPEPQWRREWPPPPVPVPVPAPDYSPHAPRRLKSALKPAYM